MGFKAPDRNDKWFYRSCQPQLISGSFSESCVEKDFEVSYKIGKKG